VDALAGLLDGPRARSAFVLRCVMRPPWSVRVQDEAPLSLIAVVRGDTWVVPDGGLPVRLTAGDVAITRGPDPFTFCDDPATPPQAVIHPGQRCTTPDGEDLHEAMTVGVRTWGNDPEGPSDMIVGTYHLEGDVGRRVLCSLPPLVVLRADHVDSPLVALLHDEVAKESAGQTAVLDRLVDLLLIKVLRAWFDRPGAGAPGWCRADSDPIVGPALRLIHHHPEHPWTVATLASEVGVSRAGLARRFTEMVGEPPMSFLTDWRLTLAADLLHEPDATLGAVARKVGYSSPYALSTAFKRVRGISPREHRLAVAS
jgi:AraC-like DNA-binding protein